MGQYITGDIIIDQWKGDNWERYAYFRRPLEKGDYDKQNLTDGEFEEWSNDNLLNEELYYLPMMNALRYFSSFVGGFTDEDNEKCSGSTCLIYDYKEEAWAVALTGGCMDLSPNLLATFVNLGKGIPRELGNSIDPQYSAYLSNEEHLRNCLILAEAYKNESKRCLRRSEELLQI